MGQNISTNMQKYASVNILKRIMIALFKRKILEIVSNQPQKRTLCDAGCGEGFIVDYLTKYLKDTEFYGFDKSETAIKLASSKHSDVKYSVDDVTACEFPNDKFDIVMLLEVLEHLENPQQAIRELLRISKKTLIISVPQEPFFCLGNFFTGKYIRSLGNPPEHINHWTYFGLKSYLNQMFVKDKVTIKLYNLLVWTVAVIEKNEQAD